MSLLLLTKNARVQKKKKTGVGTSLIRLFPFSLSGLNASYEAEVETGIKWQLSKHLLRLTKVRNTCLLSLLYHIYNWFQTRDMLYHDAK